MRDLRKEGVVQSESPVCAEPRYSAAAYVSAINSGGGVMLVSEEAVSRRVNTMSRIKDVSKTQSSCSSTKSPKASNRVYLLIL
jgi:hypothetical protein